jgi:DMATS type aromatic prenyltransferase
MAVKLCYQWRLVWKQVYSRSFLAENAHQRLWSQHVGKAIGVLLYNAGYSSHLQSRNLEFFTQLIAPNLGVFQGVTDNYTRSWRSFMTDDGSPIELSWDWGINDSRPVIRYSIEPIGLYAGTSLDPTNLLAGPALQNHLIQFLPKMRLEWYHYFKDFFDCGREKRARGAEELQDHNTSIFYAFDLSEKETIAKVYFFPKYRATSRQQSNLEVLLEAIKGAPHCTKTNLLALSVFLEFANDSASKNIEYEILAIDLIDPLESHFKIYFRSRDTSFDSVFNFMTLGGRIKHPGLDRELESLHRLCNSLFGLCESSTHLLKESNHRTAGMLYNIEFRLGDLNPVAKIYIPVRHYSKGDDAVIDALDEYFRSNQRGSYMIAYRSAISELL